MLPYVLRKEKKLEMIMKKTIFFLFILTFISLVQVNGQNSDQPLGVSFKALLMDYQSQNGGSLSAFRQYDQGFEVGFHKSINKNLNLVIPFKLGIVTSHDSINDLSETQLGLDKRRFHKFIAGVDAQIQYQFYKPTSKVIPYIMAGIGAANESDGEFNLQAPFGLGLNFKVAHNAFVNLQSEYRYSFTEGRNNLHRDVWLLEEE